MKKRITAVLLIVIVLFVSVPYAQGADGICFIGINDSVPMYLPAEHAPYYKGSVLYIPYTVFNAGPGGVAVSYNSDKGSLALFTRAKRLVYDLNEGTVTDEAAKVGRVDVVYRNGMLFIPASRAISHFGLSAVMLTGTSGNPILRITDGSQQLDNATFIRKAGTLISIILEQQDDSDKMQHGTAIPENDDPSGAGPTTIYLAIAGEAVNEQTLLALEQNGIYASFFLTKQQIMENADLVRKIYAAGHMVGLTVETSEENYEIALSEANMHLDRVIFSKSLMVLLSRGGEELQQYAVFREWAMQTNIDEVLKNSEALQLVVCRSNADYVIRQIVRSGARTMQLVETSAIPGVSIT